MWTKNNRPLTRAWLNTCQIRLSTKRSATSKVYCIICIYRIVARWMAKIRCLVIQSGLSQIWCTESPDLVYDVSLLSPNGPLPIYSRRGLSRSFWRNKTITFIYTHRTIYVVAESTVIEPMCCLYEHYDDTADFSQSPTFISSSRPLTWQDKMV